MIGNVCYHSNTDEDLNAHSYTRSSIPVTQDVLRIQFLSVETSYIKVCNVYEIYIIFFGLSAATPTSSKTTTEIVTTTTLQPTTTTTLGPKTTTTLEPTTTGPGCLQASRRHQQDVSV